jgi:hypothetical protein
MDIDLIWGGGEADYFFNEDWTAQITLKAFRKSVFGRRAFLTIDHVFRTRRSNQEAIRDNLSTHRPNERRGHMPTAVTGDQIVRGRCRGEGGP